MFWHFSRFIYIIYRARLLCIVHNKIIFCIYLLRFFGTGFQRTQKYGWLCISSDYRDYLPSFTGLWHHVQTHYITTYIEYHASCKIISPGFACWTNNTNTLWSSVKNSHDQAINFHINMEFGPKQLKKFTISIFKISCFGFQNRHFDFQNPPFWLLKSAIFQNLPADLYQELQAYSFRRCIWPWRRSGSSRTFFSSIAEEQSDLIRPPSSLPSSLNPSSSLVFCPNLSPAW